MKKKIVTLLVGALVLTAAVPSAFAALSESQTSDIAKLEAQIAGLRKQIVQKYVDGGELTTDQGKAIQAQIDQTQKAQADSGNRPGYGYGYMSGYGYGPMMGGYGYGPMTGGYGYGPMMGGYGPMTGDYGYGPMMGGYGYGSMMGGYGYGYMGGYGSPAAPSTNGK